MLMAKAVAFVSYAHFDEEYVGGEIFHLAQRLELALRAYTGRTDLSVFVDRKSIDWGDAWRGRIAEGLADSAILITIVTPNFLSSEECRNEIKEFLALRERTRWLLPIYYIDVADLETRDDPVSVAIRERQYEDWRQLRNVERTSNTVRIAIENLAKKIRDRLRTENPDLPVVKSDASREYRVQSTAANAEVGDWIDSALWADAAMENEEYGLARAVLLGALSRFDHPELWLKLAWVDWYVGALDDAVTEFERALKMGCDEITVLRVLGQARVERGEFERGIKDLTVAIERDSNYIGRAYAQSARALGLGGIGHFQEAFEEFAAAERTTPNNAWLHFNRARVLDWQGDPTARASYLRSLVLRDPPLNRPKRQMAQQRLDALGWRDDDASDGI
jgi:Tfp pilus assembly protein PilF